MALCATTALPAGVRGPVLFDPLRRFASAWRVVHPHVAGGWRLA